MKCGSRPSQPAPVGVPPGLAARRRGAPTRCGRCRRGSSRRPRERSGPPRRWRRPGRGGCATGRPAGAGGSQLVTSPQSISAPSDVRSKIRPPTPGSSTITTSGSPRHRVAPRPPRAEPGGPGVEGVVGRDTPPRRSTRSGSITWCRPEAWCSRRPAEAGGDIAPDLPQEALDRRRPFGLEPVDAPGALRLLGDQAGLLQQAKVAGHGRAADRHLVRQLAAPTGARRPAARRSARRLASPRAANGSSNVGWPSVTGSFSSVAAFSVTGQLR